MCQIASLVLRDITASHILGHPPLQRLNLHVARFISIVHKDHQSPYRLRWDFTLLMLICNKEWILVTYELIRYNASLDFIAKMVSAMLVELERMERQVDWLARTVAAYVPEDSFAPKTLSIQYLVVLGLTRLAVLQIVQTARFLQRFRWR